MNIIQIPVNQIAEHPEQYKIYGKTTVDNDFVDNIKKLGVLQPLLVMITAGSPYDGIVDQHYIAVAGHRRRFAAEIGEIPEVPCAVKFYETADDSIIDLISSNKMREKTKKQINTEFKALKQKLYQTAKLHLSQGLGDTLVSDDNDLCQNRQRSLNSRDEIAERLGLSKAGVRQLTTVIDDNYRQKAYERVAKSWEEDLSSERILKLDSDWQDIVDKFESEEITLDAASNAVSALLKEATNTKGNNTNWSPKTEKKAAKPKNPGKETQAKPQKISVDLTEVILPAKKQFVEVLATFDLSDDMTIMPVSPEWVRVRMSDERIIDIDLSNLLSQVLK